MSHNSIIPYEPHAQSIVMTPDIKVALYWSRAVADYYTVDQYNTDLLHRLYSESSQEQLKQIDALVMRTLLYDFASAQRAIIVWMYGVYIDRFGGDDNEFVLWLDSAIPAELATLHSSLVGESGKITHMARTLLHLFQLAAQDACSLENMVQIIETGIDIQGGKTSHAIQTVATTIHQTQSALGVTDGPESPQYPKWKQLVDRAVKQYHDFVDGIDGHQRSVFVERQRAIRSRAGVRTRTIGAEPTVVKITNDKVKLNRVQRFDVGEGKSITSNVIYRVIIEVPCYMDGTLVIVKGLDTLLKSIDAFQRLQREEYYVNNDESVGPKDNFQS